MQVFEIVYITNLIVFTEFIQYIFLKFLSVEKTRKIKPIDHSPGFECEEMEEEEEDIKAGPSIEPSKRGMADELSAHSTSLDPKRKFKQGNGFNKTFSKKKKNNQ